MKKIRSSFNFDKLLNIKEKKPAESIALGKEHSNVAYRLETRILLDATAPAMIIADLVNQTDPNNVSQSIESVTKTTIGPSEPTSESKDPARLNTAFSDTYQEEQTKKFNVTNTNKALIDLSEITGQNINGHVNIISNPLNGNVTFDNNTGQIIYTAKPGYTGAESFLIEVESTDLSLKAYQIELTIDNLLSDSLTDAIHNAIASNNIIHEVVFVDPSVQNYQELISNIDRDATVFILDAHQDGIHQISEIINRLNNAFGSQQIDAIHLISHGNSGQLNLGTAQLTSDTINGMYNDVLSHLGSSLTANADILIYGCEFGAGPNGEQAVSSLANITGADIAASIDKTGYSSLTLGVDWTFESTHGVIQTDNILNNDYIYTYTLNTYQVEIFIDRDLYPGETTWRFTTSTGTIVASGSSIYTDKTTTILNVNPGNYIFTIYDQWGDGIDYLDASNPTSGYEIKVNGVTYYKSSNGPNFGASASVNVTLLPIENQAPIANSDSFTIGNSSPTIINVADLLSNDTDPDNNPLSIIGVTSGTGGVAVLLGDGTIQFTPTNGFTGNAKFNYTITDGFVTTSGEVNLVINDSPVANNDSFEIRTGPSHTFSAADLLVNDTDFENDSLIIANVSDAVGGTVTLNINGTVTFTATPGYVGTGSFRYSITDSYSISTFATVTLQINGVELSLDGNGSSRPNTAGSYSTSYIPGNSGIEIVDSDFLLSSTSNLSQAEVRILNFTAGDLLTTNYTGSLTIDYNPQTGVLKILGYADAQTYKTVLESIRFSTSSNTPRPTTDRIISISATSTLANNESITSTATTTVDMLGEYATIFDSDLNQDIAPVFNNINYAAGISQTQAKTLYPGNNYGAVINSPNPKWVYFRAEDNGQITIAQTNSNNIDVDGVLWGPFESIEALRAAQGSLHDGYLIASDYLADANFTFTFNAEAGKYYLLLVTNYSNAQTNINIEFSGTEIWKIPPTINSVVTNVNIPTLTGTFSRTSSTDSLTLEINGVLHNIVTENDLINFPIEQVRTWSIQLNQPLADGVYDVTLTTRSVNGEVLYLNNDILTIDTIAPETPTINTISTSNYPITLSGTAEINTTLQLTIGNLPTIYNPVVDGNGHWSLIIADPGPLIGNIYDIKLISTDSAGNTKQDATINELNLTTPNTPPVAHDDYKSGNSNNNISGNVLNNDHDADGNTLSVNNFSIQGITGLFVSGQTVNIANIGNFTLLSNGYYNFIPNNDYQGSVPSVTYSISDSAGGISSAHLQLNVTAPPAISEPNPEVLTLIPPPIPTSTTLENISHHVNQHDISSGFQNIYNLSTANIYPDTYSTNSFKFNLFNQNIDRTLFKVYFTNKESTVDDLGNHILIVPEGKWVIYEDMYLFFEPNDPNFTGEVSVEYATITTDGIEQKFIFNMSAGQENNESEIKILEQNNNDVKTVPHAINIKNDGVGVEINETDLKKLNELFTENYPAEQNFDKVEIIITAQQFNQLNFQEQLQLIDRVVH